MASRSGVVISGDGSEELVVFGDSVGMAAG